MRTTTILKMAFAGIACCVGGPALVMYVTPDPDELFSRYNPELQAKALSEREQRLKDHGEFMAKLREYSKSDKPIWIVAAEEEKKAAKAKARERKRIREELEQQRLEILEEQKRGGK
ncbi:hypothetical protein BZA05DRAFT_140734 [Tricharina praecox]|uniref:uncharacterized protein n=1 Tax=Tricharina praecox TaxID=43433 RepID=UPI00221F0043|nr:uncharacterized protein BZA05DRAFT_140734 [Tricharina praecox]KAI5846177.1 hypothetical protein BZA05DRAFT_140734 [Tricharina praecox]